MQADTMKETNHLKDIVLMETLKSGGPAALDQFYLAHRSEFIKWAEKTFSYPAEEVADIYQDAIVIMYENIVSGKLTYLESSLKTYVFAIGKNLMLKQLSKDKKMRLQWEQFTEEPDDDLDDLLALNHQQEIALQTLETLADPCKSILISYYYKKMSMKSIANAMGYKNEDVVKSQKVRCLKALKVAVLASIKSNAADF